MIGSKKESILEEAAKNGIVALVGVMSDSLSIEAKRTRLLRIIDDLTQAVNDTKAQSSQEQEDV